MSMVTKDDCTFEVNTIDNTAPIITNLLQRIPA